MTEISNALSPIGQPDEREALAYGPFIVEHRSPEGDRTYLGFLFNRDAEEVTWLGLGHQHAAVPIGEPASEGDTIRFSSAEDGDYVLRPLGPEDAGLAGAPEGVSTENLDPTVLAQAAWDREFGPLPTEEIGEDNLYLTRNAAGEPLALMKMGAGFPTLLRQDNGWRPLADDEDGLLGASDVPVREDAVTAWDSGELQRLESLLMDDRFSPADVTSLWAEVGDTEELKRLLVERSRGRLYERTRDGKWEEAASDPDATTIDLVWGAVGAWDTGDLKKLTQAGEFDANGEAA